ncbi:hypothetical protein Godav_015579, partial [Gossypium davidsonii]|nr:hypothetical protein [Gossypium davidsonii]
MGVERGIRLEGLTEPQILKALEDLVKAEQFVSFDQPLMLQRPRRK